MLVGLDDVVLVGREFAQEPRVKEGYRLKRSLMWF